MDRQDESVVANSQAGEDRFSGETRVFLNYSSTEANLLRLVRAATPSVLLYEEISETLRMPPVLRGKSCRRLRCFLRPRIEMRASQIGILFSVQSFRAVFKFLGVQLTGMKTGAHEPTTALVRPQTSRTDHTPRSSKAS